MTDTADILSRLDELMLDPSQRHVEPHAGQIGHCRMFSQAKSIDETARTIDFVCSEATIDRYGEIVLPSAFAGSVDAFMRNPVFPYNHSYDAIAGQSPTLGHWKSLRVTDKALLGTAWFKEWGLGDQCWRDYLEGNLTSVSVAFITKAWTMREMKIDGEMRRVRVFEAVDLLEISSVLIPALPSARIRAASHAAAGASEASVLERMADTLERLEQRLAADHDGQQRTPDLDDAGATRGREDGQGFGYFGDIPGADEPDPRSADQGNSELKAALRDVLAVRGD